MDHNILVVDDEQLIQRYFSKIFKKSQYNVVFAGDLKTAREELEKKQYNLALIDLKLPDGPGLVLLKDIRRAQKDCKGIIMTGYGTINTAIESIKLGAYDYLEKPFRNNDYIHRVVKGALEPAISWDQQYDEVKAAANKTGLIVGQSEEMRQLISLAHKLSKKDISVLITGETGTGKELLARFIHAMSNRHENAFIPINCGALSENLLESELFGHEKGAFTGSTGIKKGIFELAHNGTLFLDELAEASSGIQVKLLRVLESGDFFRVGGQKLIKSDVRIIAATNGNIESMVSQFKFREDLYYRLNVARLEIPPLRKRPADIAYLANYFIKKNSGERFNKTILTDLALKVLKSYHWPGNVRQLYNVIQQMLLKKSQGGILDLKDIPKEIINDIDHVILQSETVNSTGESEEFIPRKLIELEKEYIEKTMRYFSGNISLAAGVLGLSRATLYRKIKQYRIEID